MSVTSGFNAIAHAIEALYATDCNPIIEYLASEGIRLITKSLPALEGLDAKCAREDTLKGAWYCGVALAAVRWPCTISWRMCWVEPLTFRMQKSYGIVPYSLAYNEAVLNGELKKAKRVLDTEN